MELVRVLGIGIAGTLLAVTLTRHNGSYGLLVGLATGCLLLMMLMDRTGELDTSLKELAAYGGLSSEYTGRVIRILGLACLTEAGTRICRDGGQGNIALSVELFGRVMILCAMLPAIRELLRSAAAALAELAP